MDMEERRIVKGYPGYTVTPDGRVFSSNNSRNGEPKQLLKGNMRGDRKVILCRGSQDRKHRRVSELVKDAWGTLRYFNAAQRAAADLLGSRQGAKVNGKG